MRRTLSRHVGRSRGFVRSGAAQRPLSITCLFVHSRHHPRQARDQQEQLGEPTATIMRSLGSLICALVGVGWFASLSGKLNARSVGQDQKWLFVRAIDVKQNPACIRPIDLGNVQQHPVHVLRSGESAAWDSLCRPTSTQPTSLPTDQRGRFPFVEDPSCAAKSRRGHSQPTLQPPKPKLQSAYATPQEPDLPSPLAPPSVFRAPRCLRPEHRYPGTSASST